MIRISQAINCIKGWSFTEMGLRNFEGIIYLENYATFKHFLHENSVIEKGEFDTKLLSIMGFNEIGNIYYVENINDLVIFFTHKVKGDGNYDLLDALAEERSTIDSILEKLKNIIEK